MKKILFILGMCLVTENSFCQITNDFQKGEDGMEYKIVSRGGTEPLKIGEYLSLHFMNVLSNKAVDSVLNSTRDLGMPQYMPLDSNQIPPAYMIIFKQMKVGDSVCTRTLIDSMFKKNPEQMPSFMKKGDFVYTNISIENVYKTEGEFNEARTKSIAAREKIETEKAVAQKLVDASMLESYIERNQIKAIKTANGVYVETTKLGVGPKLNNKQFVKIKYKGKTLDGNIFDTNMDASKGHEEPLLANLTTDQSLGNGVIPGMTEGLLTMQKGTKATIYIPSALGYGPRGAGADIVPNANLIFEVEVVKVLSIAQVKAEQIKSARDASKEAIQNGKNDAIKSAVDAAVGAAKEAVKAANKKKVPPVKTKVPIKKPVLKRK